MAAARSWAVSSSPSMTRTSRLSMAPERITGARLVRARFRRPRTRTHAPERKPDETRPARKYRSHMKLALPLACLLASIAPLACAPADSSESGDDLPGKPIPADEQRAGDPAKGYDALVNNGYVSCGVPYTA